MIHVIARRRCAEAIQTVGAALDRVASLAMTLRCAIIRHEDRLRAKSNFVCPIKLICPVQSLREKYSTFVFSEIMIE